MILKSLSIFILSTITLFGLEINQETAKVNLLLHSEVYIDKNQTETITSLQNKKFKPNKNELLGFGYSPNLIVWIKFSLSNTTSNTIEKVIEYDNPLTSYVDFYEGETLKKQDGLLSTTKNRKHLNPILKVQLKPNESKTFFIKASSHITTLIVKLNLMDYQDFKNEEIKHRLILALFFGAMGIIIIYNFIVFLATKELSYLYYVLFFLSISFHHLMYKGLVTLYVSTETMQTLIHNASLIVAMPMVFLALFTQHILVLKQYPKINRLLNYLLILYPIVIVLIMLTEQYQYRSFFLILLLFYLLYITLYAVIKKNQQACFIIFGLILFTTSGLFMYLSSLGILDIYTQYPYYTEFSLVAEVTLFSLALATKIKFLNQEQVKSNENALLLKELRHRVQNNMQTIFSFLVLQREYVNDTKTNEILIDLENRILATSELYLLLELKDQISIIDMEKYLSSIVNNTQNSFQCNEIKIELSTNVKIAPAYAIYCGLIVNEAVTNAFKHAFQGRNDGKINITLFQQDSKYFLSIQDNGIGFKENFQANLGMTILETLAIIQLDGTLNIAKENGTKVDVIWESKK